MTYYTEQNGYHVISNISYVTETNTSSETECSCETECLCDSCCEEEVDLPEIGNFVD